MKIFAVVVLVLIASGVFAQDKQDNDFVQMLGSHVARMLKTAPQPENADQVKALAIQVQYVKALTELVAAFQQIEIHQWQLGQVRRNTTKTHAERFLGDLPRHYAHE